MLFALTVLLTACVNEMALQPAPEGDDFSAIATQACTRKMAQLAAPYHAKGVGSRIEDARPLPNGDFAVELVTIVTYPDEEKQARVLCIVNPRGLVRSFG